jgi:hypothetical protein
VSVLDTGTLKLLGRASATASGGAVVSTDGSTLFAAAFGPDTPSVERIDLAAGGPAAAGRVTLTGAPDGASWPGARLIGAIAGQ